MTSKLKNILQTLSEKEGEEVISYFDKMDSVNGNTTSYKEFKMAAMADIRAALKSQAVTF